MPLSSTNVEIITPEEYFLTMNLKPLDHGPDVWSDAVTQFAAGAEEMLEAVVVVIDLSDCITWAKWTFADSDPLQRYPHFQVASWNVHATSPLTNSRRHSELLEV